MVKLCINILGIIIIIIILILILIHELRIPLSTSISWNRLNTAKIVEPMVALLNTWLPLRGFFRTPGTHRFVGGLPIKNGDFQ